MTSVAASEGYANATIAKVIAQAGVSRPTFYDYFVDRDDCVIASAQVVGEQLLEHVERAADSSGAYALSSAVEAHVEFARRHPSEARFLFSETLAGGPRTLDERDRLIAGLAEHVENAYDDLSPRTGIPDVASRIVIGGVWRLMAGRIRGGALELDGFVDELSAWVGRYAAPLDEHRWRTLRPVAAVSPSTSFVIEAPLRAPATIPPGRPRISREEVRENHRRRILAAVTQAAKEKGYTATTIADISRIAGVDARVFSGLFSGKQEAFLAAHELGVQATMAATAAAFLVEASWPERVWSAGLAFTGFLEANPLIAHNGFVEAYAVGSDAVKLIEDSRAGFTIFLQEGYQAYPQSDPPSRDALDAIAATTFELAYSLTREEVQHGMAGLLGNVVYLALTPFMGAQAANRFIEYKLHT